MSEKAKEFITALFKISGITINGSKPYDITINNENFYDRIVKHGELGLGESYMDRWWEAGAVDQFIDKCGDTNYQFVNGMPNLAF